MWHRLLNNSFNKLFIIAFFYLFNKFARSLAKIKNDQVIFLYDFNV